MASRIERALLWVTPAAAVTTVALGLRLGAGDTLLAAVVVAAASSKAETGLAWQLRTLRESEAGREPVALRSIRIRVSTRSAQASWEGATNDDGVAEPFLAVPALDPIHLEVWSGPTLLAAGDARPPPAAAVHAPPALGPVTSAWARFARREGAVLLDVAVLGQRVAPGFPATVWVRATDSATGAPIQGASIVPTAEASFAPAVDTARTDARGWARVIATPIGHVVTMEVLGRAPDGREGQWTGGIYVSPGAAKLTAPARFSLDEAPQINLELSTVRMLEYVEIDDASGRVWAATVPLEADGGAARHAQIVAPQLPAGLYWIVSSGDPAGAAALGPGTAALPFFVARSDDDALRLEGDLAECAPPRDRGEVRRVLEICRALVAPTPVPRWTAVDGFPALYARRTAARTRGLVVALAGVGVGSLLEIVLLIRASRGMPSFAVSPGPQAAGRPFAIALAILVALLGFVLLTAFLLRLA
jgi:hypothetical protein